MKKWWIDYFTFSKKERIGVIVLLILIGLVWILPVLFKKSTSIEPFVQLEAAVSDSHQVVVPNKSATLTRENVNIAAIKPFLFDPNTIDDNGWLALGLQPKTIATIQHYKEKGGHFRKPDDIRRIYGIRNDLANLLVPFVRILSENHVQRQPHNKFISFDNRKIYKDTIRFSNKSIPYSRKYERSKLESIDINIADSMAFVSLPGIGPTLAQRIMRFRDNLGGFYSLNQLLEVYGIKDSVYQLIQPRLTCTVNVQKILINQADFNALNKHPYISYQEAKAIVNFRMQHSYFKQPADLLQLVLLNEQWLQKVNPYLSFETDTEK